MASPILKAVPRHDNPKNTQKIRHKKVIAQSLFLDFQK
jgi:hypothetical protein